MSFMDQNSIDALLAQVQADADGVKAAATPGDAATVAAAAGDIFDIAGDMEPPAPKGVGSAAEAQGHAGEAPGFSQPAVSSMHQRDLQRLLTIEVPVIVQLGIRRMTVGEVMRLGVGAIVEFGKSAEEEMDLLANNKPIGKGHAVKVGENFGIKISSIAPVKETIRRLGGF